MANDTYAQAYRRIRRAPSHLEPTSFQRKSTDGNQSNSSSPASAGTRSPSTSLSLEGSVPQMPSDNDFDATREPVSGPHTTKLKGKADCNGRKQKRNRVCVLPEQRANLERFFSVNRHPTAGQRKEISEQLGMEARKAQVWFQNRQVQIHAIARPVLI